ncbi:MAG: hypothetical protein K5880_10930 [Hydrogenophaga sp.]|uniref:hypothetical protein n=1 Tax=Hydrogenophaga sp. TaxID=1904254 RepID=UPI002631A188|nr:hypothetical protein [Hydrogenophaga sp.]MCV0439139.1 hypothetical protein [Hydrogenophaga sp.]
MKVFIGLNSHSNKVSLPLRFGVSLTEQHQQFATLSNPVFDPAATDSQRPDEIARMRKHYSGRLVVPHASGSAAEAYALDCRIVLELPTDDSRVPAVITVLSISSTKGDATVTRHLEGMLKKGRISKQDLIDVFHPAYAQGKIADSTDCEEVFREHLEQSTPAVDAGDNLGQQVVVSAEPVVRLVEAIADSQAEALEGPPRFSEVVPLRTKYQYVFADAYLRDVWLSDGRIHVKCIGSNGDDVTLQSFSARPHLAEHHQRAYEYLSDRKEQRAVFAVCVSSPYKGVLAESVTSISLQLMKTSLARADRTPTVPATGPAMNSIARSRTWETDAAELFFESNPSLMTDDEFEMIYGYER